MNNLEQVWKNALKHLKETLPTASFQAWIKTAKLSNLEQHKALLHVKNEFSRNLLVQNYYSAICQALGKASGQQNIQLIIEVKSDLVTNSENEAPSLASLQDTQALPKIAVPSDSNLRTFRNLNPRYSFENFIVGSNNQFCHAAALAIAEGRSEETYNPFFIYGDVGLGKTHIMQAIGNHVLKKNSAAKILYLSAEEFLNDLIASMRKNKMNEFRKRYRSAWDFLMIDDIQFIEGKEATQEEFFHTFNILKEHGSQIVLTSDRPPAEIGLDKRLISRFQCGLEVDIKPPSYETRLAIVLRRAEDLKLKLKPEIAELIANLCPENIRRLEGALIKLQAYLNFTAKPLTLNFVKQALGSKENQTVQTKTIYPQTSSNDSEKQKLAQLAELVADRMGILVAQILGRENTSSIKHARQIFMTIARQIGFSIQEIGTLCDGRSNSSILNSARRVEKEAKTNNKLSSLLKEIIDSAHKQSITKL